MILASRFSGALLSVLAIAAAAWPGSASAARGTAAPQELSKRGAALVAGGVGSSGGPQGRIVGGSQTLIASVPWQVDVWSVNGNLERDCGGSILNSTTVLTAAHCVDGLTVGADAMHNGLAVWAGVSSIVKLQPGDALQERKVTAAKVHPLWNPAANSTTGDLAILTLETPLDLNVPTAHAIGLPAIQAPVDGEPIPVTPAVSVTGYGRQAAGLDSNGLLYTLAAAIVDPSVCGDDAENAIELCVQTPVGVSCQGDSGGPLVAAGILVGVVSNGPAGCTPNDGDHYVNLAAPENRLFLEGQVPPSAPRQLAPITAAYPVTMRAGSAITCQGGGWSNAPQVKWKVTNETGALLGAGVGPTFAYTLTTADIGHKVGCRAQASNAGGVQLSERAAIDIAVAPRPTPPPLLMRGFAPSKVKRGHHYKLVFNLSGIASADSTVAGVVLRRLGKKHADTKTSPVTVLGGTTRRLVLTLRVSRHEKIGKKLKYGVYVFTEDAAGTPVQENYYRFSVRVKR